MPGFHKMCDLKVILGVNVYKNESLDGSIVARFFLIHLINKGLYAERRCTPR